MADGAMAFVHTKVYIHGFSIPAKSIKVVNMDLKDEINKLMDALIFVESKGLRKIMVDAFEKKMGEIPEEYRDAINALIEM